MTILEFLFCLSTKN